jgi:acyl-CoA thioesterase I
MREAQFPDGIVTETSVSIRVMTGFWKLLQTFFASIIIFSILVMNGVSVRAAFADAKDTESQAANKTLRILCYGDSLTAGYGLDREKAFPAQLEKVLREKGHSVEIVNAGVSGDTSRQALSRIDWSLRRGGPFDVVLLGIGANDGLRRNDVNQMRENIEKMIQKFRDAGLKVYLLGMRLPLNYEENYRKSFEKVYPDLEKKYALDLYPFILEGIALEANYNLEDLIHPNQAGHLLLAQKLADWLLKKDLFK